MANFKEYLMTGAMIFNTALPILPAYPVGNKLERKLIIPETKKIIVPQSNFSNIFYLEQKEIFEEKQRARELARQNNQPVYIPTNSEILKLSQIVYAEAANQSEEAWGDIVQLVKNRKQNPDYPNSIEGIIDYPGTFSCMTDKRNNNWKQMMGELPMNGYEKMVFGDITKKVEDTLASTRVEKRKENIMAYYDGSMKNKPISEYWNSLEITHKVDDLTFCSPKEIKELQQSSVAYVPNTGFIINDKEIGQVIYSDKRNEIKIIKAAPNRGLLARATEIRNAA